MSGSFWGGIIQQQCHDYQASEEGHEFLMARADTVEHFEIEPPHALCRAERTFAWTQVSHFGLEFHQMLFNTEEHE